MESAYTVEGDLIVVGGEYESRGGNKWVIYRVEPSSDWPMRGKCKASDRRTGFTREGRYLNNAPNSHDLMRRVNNKEKTMSNGVSNLEKLKEIPEMIDHAMSWHRTPQGFSYWAEVNRNLRELIESQDKKTIKILGKDVELSDDAYEALQEVLEEVPELNEVLIKV